MISAVYFRGDEMTVMRIDSPVGELWLGEEECMLCLVSAKKPASVEEGRTPLLESAASQLGEYFTGRRKAFDLPLKLSAKGFAGRVYEEMRKIPYGKTVSYRQLAAAAGSPKAFRAVGNICGANPLVMLIPCHRVICADGRLGGYALGAEHKIWLIKHEALNADETE